MNGRLRDVERFGDFALGLAFCVEQEATFLLGGERCQRGFKIQLLNELLVDLRAETLSDFQFGRAEGCSILLDLLEVEVADMFSGQGMRTFPEPCSPR